MWIEYYLRLAYIVSTVVMVTGFTGDDIFGCLPCTEGEVIVDPNDCTKYYFCNIARDWQPTLCPSSLYFNVKKNKCSLYQGSLHNCTQQPGYAEHLSRNIEEVVTCPKVVTVRLITTPSSNVNKTGSGGPATTVISSTDKGTEGGNNKTTVLLAALLTVAVVLLVAVVVGILVYRWIQNRRRPKTFQSRPLPSTSKAQTLPPPYTSSDPKTSAANAAYLSRSLLIQPTTPRRPSEQQPFTHTHNDDDSEEAGYMEIPEKPYYSDPEALKSKFDPDHVYEEAEQPGASADKYGYQQPSNQSEGGHEYTHPDQNQVMSPSHDTYADENTEYCDPEANHTTGLTLDLDPRNTIILTNEETTTSAPYYIDAIPDTPTSPPPTHNYHTLEPPNRQK